MARERYTRSGKLEVVHAVAGDPNAAPVSTHDLGVLPSHDAFASAGGGSAAGAAAGGSSSDAAPSNPFAAPDPQRSGSVDPPAAGDRIVPRPGTKIVTRTVTETVTRTVTELGDGSGGADEDAVRRVDERDPARDPQAPFFVVGTALTLLAALLLVFAADLLVVGHIRHARDQQTAFADLRADLANGTAPVNQTTDDGKLVPLGKALGVLEIEQVRVREVFFEGTSSGVLMSGPGHRRDTVLPGQPGTSEIMGRKAGYGGPFSYLEQVLPGSRITTYTGQGRADYVVTGIRRAGDLEPAALGAGQGRLTLVTAIGDDYVPEGTLRVDASLISTSPDLKSVVQQAFPAGPRPLTALQLPISERPMQGDTAAWVDVVLWALALCLASFGVTWLRMRWGRWQTWLAGGPVLLALALATSDQVARLLPNLL